MVEIRGFLDQGLDPAAIDRNADIPRSVIDGLGRVGVLGMTAPKEFGGHGFSQMANCKILEEIGSRCASTSVFVNAHHSIGIRALLAFRNAGAKADLAAAPCFRRAPGGFCPDRRAGRLGRGQRPDGGAVQAKMAAITF